MDVRACPSCGVRNRVRSGVRGRPRCSACGADLPWLVDAGDDDFAEAVDTARLVLVDLWAPWCGPCRAVAPTLELLAGEYAGRLKVVKVNVDSSPAVARRFDARSIPLLVFLRDGRPVDTIVGAQPAHVVRARVEQLVGATTGA